MVKVYHAPNTRSLRVLWTLEELGVPYETVRLQFPPRQHHPEYLTINPTGSLPAMVDGDVTLTESMAICEYLNDKHGGGLAVAPGEAGRADYVQWLFFGEASLSPPLGNLVRISRMESPGADLAAFAEGARQTYINRLAGLEARLQGQQYVTGGRFTLADISSGYALNLAGLLNLSDLMGPNVAAYWDRLQARPALQRAKAVP